MVVVVVACVPNEVVVVVSVGVLMYPRMMSPMGIPIMRNTIPKPTRTKSPKTINQAFIKEIFGRRGYILVGVDAFSNRDCELVWGGDFLYYVSLIAFLYFL